jgi:hypothetical protein
MLFAILSIDIYFQITIFLLAQPKRSMAKWRHEHRSAKADCSSDTRRRIAEIQSLGRHRRQDAGGHYTVSDLHLHQDRQNAQRNPGMSLITEEIVDQAIAAAKAGHLNGLEYSQRAWCGTSCCVLGFARHIAGLPEFNGGPLDEEFASSARLVTIRRLMRCGSPDILRIMENVQPDGKIILARADLSGADLRGADLGWANLSVADLSGARLSGARGADIGVDLALLQTSEEWLAVAMLAGYREGPSDVTRALIIERLLQFEQQTPGTIQ